MRAEVARLLRYARPYAGSLALSVLLMSFVGASQAMMARLIVPLFDFVLQPQAQTREVLIFAVPGFGWKLLLSDFLPEGVHNIWTAVAIGIITAFPSSCGTMAVRV